jgi:L-seryl-tRNA(Ser) seleniumtransferase
LLPDEPSAAALAADAAAVLQRAERVVARLVTAGLDATVTAAKAAVGGGGAPGVELESYAVSLPEPLAVPLRTGEPAVVGRLEGGRLLLDLRSVHPGDDDTLITAILAAARPAPGVPS